MDAVAPSIDRAFCSEWVSLFSAPKELVSFVSDRPGHDRRYAVDCNKIKKNLSWVCQYDFKQSLSDTIDWYFKKSD